MRHGGGVIMLGSVDDPPARHRPGVYLVAPDVDAHFVRAAVAGTGIVYPPEDTEFGARRYRTRDPEGHEWNFDSYRPSLEASHWTPEA